MTTAGTRKCRLSRQPLAGLYRHTPVICQQPVICRRCVIHPSYVNSSSYDRHNVHNSSYARQLPIICPSVHHMPVSPSYARQALATRLSYAVVVCQENVWHVAVRPLICCRLPHSFASTSRNQPIHLWDAFTGQLRCSYRSHDHMVSQSAVTWPHCEPIHCHMTTWWANPLVVIYLRWIKLSLDQSELVSDWACVKLSRCQIEPMSDWAAVRLSRCHIEPAFRMSWLRHTASASAWTASDFTADSTGWSGYLMWRGRDGTANSDRHSVRRPLPHPLYTLVAPYHAHYTPSSPPTTPIIHPRRPLPHPLYTLVAPYHTHYTPSSPPTTPIIHPRRPLPHPLYTLVRSYQ